MAQQFRPITAAEKAASAEVASARLAVMSDLTRGRITVDEARARNRALRAEHGDRLYEASAGVAVANHVARFG